MGLTCVVRWKDASSQVSINYIQDRALKHYQGRLAGRWSMQCRLYREAVAGRPQGSSTTSSPSRLMYHLSLSQHPGTVFVYIDGQPESDITENVTGVPSSETASGITKGMMVSTSPTMEHIVSRLKFAWTLRQSMQVDGFSCHIGDFIVRQANVSIGGAGYRGVIIEAEYTSITEIPNDYDEAVQTLIELVQNLLPTGADISYHLTSTEKPLDFTKASLPITGEFTPLHTAFQYIHLLQSDHVM